MPYYAYSYPTYYNYNYNNSGYGYGGGYDGGYDGGYGWGGWGFGGGYPYGYYSGYYPSPYFADYAGGYAGDYVPNYTTGQEAYPFLGNNANTFPQNWYYPPVARTDEETRLRITAKPTFSTDQANAPYQSQAVTAFGQGDYREAARLAGHAALDAPRSAKVHELLSLALFALGDYRGASIEAHAALALGPAADWKTLYSYYGSLDTYLKHLKGLQEYAGGHPKSLDAWFLMGYHNLMMGHRQDAQEQLAYVASQAPQDKVTAGLIRDLQPQATAPPPAKRP